MEDVKAIPAHRGTYLRDLTSLIWRSVIVLQWQLSAADLITFHLADYQTLRNF